MLHSRTEYTLSELIPLFSFTEYALAEMIPKYPHLVKLGVRLEFRQEENIAFHTSFDKCKNVKNLNARFEVEGKAMKTFLN